MTNLPPKTSRAVTLRDVASAVGVSDFTVSCALNGKSGVSQTTRQIVLEAARSLGYTPNLHAQRLAKGLSNRHIDIVSLRLDWGMGARKARWIQSLLLEQGYAAPVHAYQTRPDAPETGEEFIATLCGQRPRAIVFDSAAMQQNEFAELERYQREGGIVVCYGYLGVNRPELFDYVLLDGQHNVRLAIEHLTGLGHQNIGFYHPAVAPTVSGSLRVFRQAMEEHSLTARPEWMFHSPDNAENWESEEVGGLMSQHFLQLRERPTAVMVVNDHAALRFIGDLFHAGVRVPGDLSVIGHDDRTLGRCAPVPLSSLTHPAEEMAQMVVSLLEERLRPHGTRNGSNAPRQVVIRGELRARASTQPPGRSTAQGRGQPKHAPRSQTSQSPTTQPRMRAKVAENATAR